MKTRYATLGTLVLTLALYLSGHAQSSTALPSEWRSIVSSSGDSLSNTAYDLRLPKGYAATQEWPMLVYIRMRDRFSAAESPVDTLMANLGVLSDAYGIIVVRPEGLSDTLSITANVLRVGQAMEAVTQEQRVDGERIYTIGQGPSGRFANLMPLLVKEIAGTISIDADLANPQLLDAKNRFHYVAVNAEDDFSYTESLIQNGTLDRLRFPHQLLVPGVGETGSSLRWLDLAYGYLEAGAMREGQAEKDSLRLQELLAKGRATAERARRSGALLRSGRNLASLRSAVLGLLPVDQLDSLQRALKRDKRYRNQRRQEESAILKEQLLKDDYAVFLREDLTLYNFNNLGWWNYQIGELNTFISGEKPSEQKMGRRLLGFVNALVEDNIQGVASDEEVDEEALIYLYMLKTLTDPKAYFAYLNVIALASKNDDQGTALFYLEELLEQGFRDADALYALEHTALLRITPEFNALMERYLGAARYREVPD